MKTVPHHFHVQANTINIQYLCEHEKSLTIFIFMFSSSIYCARTSCVTNASAFNSSAPDNNHLQFLHDFKIETVSLAFEHLILLILTCHLLLMEIAYGKRSSYISAFCFLSFKLNC